METDQKSLIYKIEMKKRVIEEVVQEWRSEKFYLIKIIEENMKMGNGPEGAQKIVSRKKLELILHWTLLVYNMHLKIQ